MYPKVFCVFFYTRSLDNKIVTAVKEGHKMQHQGHVIIVTVLYIVSRVFLTSFIFNAYKHI
jgi:hypothetical protein